MILPVVGTKETAVLAAYLSRMSHPVLIQPLHMFDLPQTFQRFRPEWTSLKLRSWYRINWFWKAQLWLWLQKSVSFALPICNWNHQLQISVRTCDSTLPAPGTNDDLDNLAIFSCLCAPFGDAFWYPQKVSWKIILWKLVIDPTIDHLISDTFFFVQCAGYEKRWDFPGHDWFSDGSPLFSPCFLAETQMAKLSTSHWSSCIPSPFFKCWIRYVSMSWTRGKIQEHPSASGNGNDNLLAKHVPSNHINSSSWNLA